MKITIVFLIGITNVLAWGEWCSTSINRLWEGPDDFTDIIAKKQKYEDTSFNGMSMLYWPFLIGETKAVDFNINRIFGSYSFQRIKDVYPTATLWGNNNPQWHDIM